jgi:hypothetical protein
MKSLKLNICLLFSLMMAVSCNDYLDMQPIDPFLTEEQVFAKFSTVNQYLAGLPNWIPKEWLNGPVTQDETVPWLAASDEMDISFNNDFVRMFNGSWTQSSYLYDKWRQCYLGIRQCNYFLKNIGLCLDPDLTETYRKAYMAEARFLRAYYYYYLIRMYGPVPLVGDEPVDPNADFHIARSKYEDCVKYVCDELTAVATELDIEPLNNLQGKPTRGMALAVKSRLLLYAASPLYNNPGNNSLYKGWVNAGGEPLIPTTFDVEKWKVAADAALDVINLRDNAGAKKYELMTVTRKVINNGVEQEVMDPYESLRNIYESPWNREIIYGRNIADDHTYYQRCVPRGVTGDAWGGFGPTLQQADAYAMSTGKYPITPVYQGINYSYTIDASTGYSEDGFDDFVHPYDNYKQRTPKMFINREPRFYMDICWNSMTCFFGISSPQEPTASNSIKVEGHSGANSGIGVSANYSLTGLWLRKWNPRRNNLSSRTYVNNLSWPMIRLAEVYLNYTEAMIEYNPVQLDYSYWDELRTRAGLPPILEVYPEALGNQEMLRDLIRRERRVELAFENNRFFDTRRWQIAENTDAGYMWGFNIMAASSAENSAFWKRTHTTRGRRYFEKKQYLWPIAQNEVDRNNLIIQSPYW